jgi:hypothetical protein
VIPAAGGGNGGGQTVFARVVDNGADPPDPAAGCEPRHRHAMCRSQGLEVGEGTESMYSEPFCQIATAPSPPPPPASAARTRAATDARSATAHHPGQAASDPCPPCRHRRIGPASSPPSRTRHRAAAPPRPATTRPSTPPTRPGSARPRTPAGTACAACSPRHPFVTGQPRTLPQSLTYPSGCKSNVCLIDFAYRAS